MAHAPDPVIRIYPDLLAARNFALSWFPEHSFRTEGMPSDALEGLRAVAGIEVHFAWPLADDSGFLRDFVLGDDRECYLLAIEAHSAQRGKVRSHKAMFSRGTRAGGALELEVPLSEGSSHFVGLVHVRPSNVEECSRWLADGERACIISTTRSAVYSAEFAEWVLRLIPSLPGAGYLDYASLAGRLCSQGDRLYRMGGYSGDGDADFQLFVPAADKDRIVERVQTLLRSAGL